MELIFELVFELVFEVLAELLVNVGFRGTGRMLRSRVVRLILLTATGFGAGLWWGLWLTERGRVEEPRTLWVSLALAVVTGLTALWRWRYPPTGEAGVLSPPWRWPAERFLSFALLNAAVAAGIAIGFNPQPLR